MIKPALLAAALLASPALAQDEPPSEEAPAGEPELDIVARIDLFSDYRFRGVSRSDEDPAVQAGVALYHESGFYAGARATSLAGIDRFRLQDQGDAQIDLYAGYGTDLGGGFSVEAGVMYYAFADAAGPADHVEPYASLSYLIGPVQLTGGAKYAPAQAGTRDEDMLYLYGQADFTVPFRPWSFSAQLGHQDWGFGRCGLPRSPQPCPGGMAGLPNFGDYWTWSLGGRYHVQLEGVPNTEIGLSYVDSDLPAPAGGDGAVVLSVEIGF